MTILLHALSLENYRGIGPETQYMTGFKQLNFFVGTNNSGKSIILNFIADYLGPNATQTIRQIDINSSERFRGIDGGAPAAKVGIPYQLVVKKLGSRKKVELEQQPRVQGMADLVIKRSSVLDNIWLTNPSDNNTYVAQDFLADITADNNYNNNWNIIWRTLRPGVSGGRVDLWRRESLDLLQACANFTAPQPVSFLQNVRWASKTKRLMTCLERV